MPYRGRTRSNLRPIHRIKHVVDTQFATAAGAIFDVSLVSTVDAPVLANTNEVETGSNVNGIYLHVELNITTAAALANAYLMVFKNPGNNLAMPNPNVVGADDNKRYVIHQEMLMMQQVANSNPRTIFNGVIRLPKGYRRMGPDDEVTVRVLTPGVAANWCLQAHYKEFR